MPIKVSRIKAGLYLSVWSGIITLDEVYQSADDAKRLVREDGVPLHVAIIDGSEGKGVPMDIRTMRNGTPPDRIMTLVVNAPMLGKVLGRMLVKTTNVPLEFCNTMEEALARANVLLKDAGIS